MSKWLKNFLPWNMATLVKFLQKQFVAKWQNFTAKKTIGIGLSLRFLYLKSLINATVLITTVTLCWRTPHKSCAHQWRCHASVFMHNLVRCRYIWLPTQAPPKPYRMDSHFGFAWNNTMQCQNTSMRLQRNTYNNTLKITQQLSAILWELLTKCQTVTFIITKSSNKYAVLNIYNRLESSIC
jgi:hypothetical protein